MAGQSPFVTLEKHQNFAVIRWNRPAKKNAIIPEMYVTFSEYLEQADRDDDVSLVVVTGTGDYYSSGADLTPTSESVTISKRHKILLNFFKSVIHFRKPIIAAVNGPAIGIAVTTLPLFDVIYASSTSTFQTPFSKVGIVPEAASSYTFTKIMGYSKAHEMLILNRTITAVESQASGLTSDIFPHDTFMEEVYKRVSEYVENPIKCLIYGKELIRGREKATLLQAYEEEACRLAERRTSEDRKRQIQKFIENRRKMREQRRSKL